MKYYNRIFEELHVKLSFSTFASRPDLKERANNPYDAKPFGQTILPICRFRWSYIKRVDQTCVLTYIDPLTHVHTLEIDIIIFIPFHTNGW